MVCCFRLPASGFRLPASGYRLPATGSAKDLQHHANYLNALLDWTRSQVNAGRTREQVLESKDMIPGFDDYGPLTQRPLGAAYDEVTGR